MDNDNDFNDDTVWNDGQTYDIGTVVIGGNAYPVLDLRIVEGAFRYTIHCTEAEAGEKIYALRGKDGTLVARGAFMAPAGYLHVELSMHVNDAAADSYTAFLEKSGLAEPKVPDKVLAIVRAPYWMSVLLVALLMVLTFILIVNGIKVLV